MIHVIRGTDVPVRHSYYHSFLKHFENESKDGNVYVKENKDIYTNKQVETFLEIRLVDEETGEQVDYSKTCIAEGQCPEWNELLDFKLVAKNRKAFTKQELEQSKLVIYFTLFDQLIKEDPLGKFKKIVQRENRFLGSQKIPLQSILQNSKFEGHIKLNRPLVLQDYVVV